MEIKNIYKTIKENDGTYSIRYSKMGGNWEITILGIRGCNVNRVINEYFKPKNSWVHLEDYPLELFKE